MICECDDTDLDTDKLQFRINVIKWELQLDCMQIGIENHELKFKF